MMSRLAVQVERVCPGCSASVWGVCEGACLNGSRMDPGVGWDRPLGLCPARGLLDDLIASTHTCPPVYSCYYGAERLAMIQKERGLSPATETLPLCWLERQLPRVANPQGLALTF
ncbi:hypothetical protein AOLI_G00164380 [Acnodon oligacanthus]